MQGLSQPGLSLGCVRNAAKQASMTLLVRATRVRAYCMFQLSLDLVATFLFRTKTLIILSRCGLRIEVDIVALAAGGRAARPRNRLTPETILK